MSRTKDVLAEVAIKGKEDSAFTLRASQHLSVARPWRVFRVRGRGKCRHRMHVRTTCIETVKTYT